MRPIAEALAKVLLEHHRQLCRPLKQTAAVGVTEQQVSHCVISYGELCRKAHPSCAPVGAGGFLYEIHQWCVKEKKWPPLNSLVVNKQTKEPGQNYPSRHWKNEVRNCIAFSYPDRPL